MKKQLKKQLLVLTPGLGGGPATSALAVLHPSSSWILVHDGFKAQHPASACCLTPKSTQILNAINKCQQVAWVGGWGPRRNSALDLASDTADILSHPQHLQHTPGQNLCRNGKCWLIWGFKRREPSSTSPGPAQPPCWRGGKSPIDPVTQSHISAQPLPLLSLMDSHPMSWSESDKGKTGAFSTRH